MFNTNLTWPFGLGPLRLLSNNPLILTFIGTPDNPPDGDGTPDNPPDDDPTAPPPGE